MSTKKAQPIFSNRVEKRLISVAASAIAKLMLFVLLSPAMVFVIIVFGDMAFGMSLNIGQSLAIWLVLVAVI